MSVVCVNQLPNMLLIFLQEMLHVHLYFEREKKREEENVHMCTPKSAVQNSTFIYRQLQNSGNFTVTKHAGCCYFCTITLARLSAELILHIVHHCVCHSSLTDGSTLWSWSREKATLSFVKTAFLSASSSSSW